jgi:membrane-associated phospholipid phosphatase
MVKLTKKSWIELAVGVVVFGALITVAAFLDLQINKALYFPGCFYGQFFANLGETPTYIAAPVIGMLLFLQGFGKNKAVRILLKVLFGLLVAGGWYFCMHWFWGRFAAEPFSFAIAYQIAFALVMTGFTFAIGLLIPKPLAKKLLWFALFYLFIAVFVNGVIMGMKELWARERFRVMVGALDRSAVPNGNYQGFTPWYLPQGFADRAPAYVVSMENIDTTVFGHTGDAFKSFPSGHSGAAAAIMALIILPDIFPKTLGGWKKKLLWIFPLAYIGAVALSRIIVGAHYLSDVTFGGFIGIGFAVLMRWVLISGVKNLNQEPEAVAEAVEAPAEIDEAAAETAAETAEVSAEN